MKGTITKAAGALCVAAAALVSSGATAQTSENWQFGLQIYGWFPSISGKTNFPHESPPSNISIDADNILSDLKFAFMGSFEARKGRWGGFTDFVYLDAGGDRSETREFTVGGNPLPSGATASTNYDLEGFLWTLAASYRTVADPTATLDVFAGARLADIEQELTFGVSGNIGSIPLPGRSGSRKVSKDFWDGIVGVKGRLHFAHDRNWFIPYYFDIGTGDSDLTWQAMAGLGYSFPWGDIVGAWRYLDYEFKSSSPIQDLNLNGPALSVVFRW